MYKCKVKYTNLCCKMTIRFLIVSKESNVTVQLRVSEEKYLTRYATSFMCSMQMWVCQSMLCAVRVQDLNNRTYCG